MLLIEKANEFSKAAATAWCTVRSFASGISCYGRAMRMPGFSQGSLLSGISWPARTLSRVALQAQLRPNSPSRSPCSIPRDTVSSRT